jgi:DnaJ-class molecular chaperone
MNFFNSYQNNELYKVLGLKPNASIDEIKEAYKKLAIKTHPDKNGGSKEEFIKIKDAYDKLIEKKNKEENVPFSFFKNVFDQSSKTIQHEVYVSLEELFIGGVKKIKITDENDCQNCRTICIKCNGKGKILITHNNFNMVFSSVLTPCSLCKGTGGEYKNIPDCKSCYGNKKIKIEKIFDVRIPKIYGINDRHKFMFNDKIITIQFLLQKHKHFEIRGYDIIYTFEIDLKNALCCEEFLSFKHLDGRLIKIQLSDEEVISNDTVKEIHNEGLEKPDKTRGNIIVQFKILFPKNISKHVKKDMKNLFEKI